MLLLVSSPPLYGSLIRTAVPVIFSPTLCDTHSRYVAVIAGAPPYCGPAFAALDARDYPRRGGGGGRPYGM